MPGAGIAVEDLHHRYPGPAGPVPVLSGLDLEVRAGEHVVVVGPSGSGKSTLLALLGGLQPPQTGVVEVGGRDLRSLTGEALADFRRETVGFVFQHFGLLDALTAEENVELAATLAGVRRSVRRDRARALLSAVGLSDRGPHRPPQLSGGERQRVAVARALVNRPRLVLADEPTGNLDAASSAMVGDLLATLPTEHACTVLVATHDELLAAPADRRLALEDGALIPVGSEP